MSDRIVTDNQGNVLLELPEMTGKKDVFISYRREDGNIQFVARLYNELDHNNVKAWLDIERLPHEAGDEFLKKIHEGIRASEYFLLIYTKSVEDSDFIVDKELKYALAEKKTILFYPKEPIDLDTSRLKDMVKDIQWVDTSETAMFQKDTQESLQDEKKRFELAALTNRNGEFTIYDDQNLFLIRIALQRKLNRITPFGEYKKLCCVRENEFYNNKSLQLIVENIGLFLTPPSQYKDRLHKFFNRGDREESKIVERHIDARNIDRQSLMNDLIDFINVHSDVYSMEIIHSWLETHLYNPLYKDISLPKKEEMTVGRFIGIVTEITACGIISDMETKTMFNGCELGVYDISDGKIPDIEYPDVEVKLYYSDYFTFKCMTEMYHILCSINAVPFDDISRSNIRKFAPFLCSLGLGGYLAINDNGVYKLLWTKRSSGISSGNTWHFSYDETVSLLKDSTGGEKRIKVADDGKVHLIPNDILYRAMKEELGVDRDKVEQDHHGLFEIGLIRSERLEVELISSAILHLDEDEGPLETQIKSMYDASVDGHMEVSKLKIFPLHGTSHLVGKLINPEAYAISVRMKSRLFPNIGKKAKIGINTIIEAGSFVDDGAEVGSGCKIHRNVYVGKGVRIGNNVKIQNNNSIYPGVILCDGTFVGTNVSFVNDRYPRSVRKSDRCPVDATDWTLEKTVVKEGASIGAGAVILCGVTIGEWAMVGCGAVVVKDVAPYTTVVGNPAREIPSNGK